MRLASGKYAYVTITETKPLRDGMARLYDEFVAVAARFGEQLPGRGDTPTATRDSGASESVAKKELDDRSSLELTSHRLLFSRT